MVLLTLMWILFVGTMSNTLDVADAIGVADGVDVVSLYCL